MNKHFRVVNKRNFEAVRDNRKIDDVLQYVKYPEVGDVVCYREEVQNKGEHVLQFPRLLERIVKRIEPSVAKGYAWVFYERGEC